MKVAKNKMSAFQNLFIVIQSLSNQEKEEFSKFLKEKRKLTNNNKLFKTINELIVNNETIDTINESNIKKEVENSFSNNFNKLTENLYKKLLLFLSEKYKKDEWKRWQVEANQTLLEIETLCSRNLYSQAVALMLKLEKRLIQKEDKKNWIYDDYSAFARLANLKIMLLRFANNLYDNDEIDKVLYELMRIGDMIRYPNDNFKIHHSFFKYKLLGHQLLVKYFTEKELYKEAMRSVEQIINTIEIENDEHYNVRSKNLSDFFDIYKMFLEDKFGKGNVLKTRQKKQDTIVSVMLREQMIRDIAQSFSKPELENTNKDEAQYYIDLLFYSEKKINNLPDRLELNRAIFYYLNHKYSDSLEILKELKSKQRNKQKDNPIFLDILFLELFCKKNNGEYDLDSLVRSIKSIIKGQSRNLEFEKLALKLYEKQLNKYLKIDFIKEYPKELKKLNNSINKFEPMNNIILQTLLNEV